MTTAEENPEVLREQFSLLLPVYAGDRSQYLKRAFRSSVNDQTVKPSEIVIVQDGPVSAALAEALAEIVASSPIKARLIELPQNGGLAAALERGLAECTNDLVARMDADDISLPTRFERQLELIATGMDLVGTGMYEFTDENGEVVGTRTPPVGSATIANYARFHDPFNHPTVLYRRAAVRVAGGYLPMGLMEDYFLFARMIKSGARVANLPEPLLMYRVGDGAYARRGGWHQLRAEFALQSEFHRSGFTTGGQAVRNVLVRGAYRLVPEGVRRIAYRRFIAPDTSGRLVKLRRPKWHRTN